MCMLSYFPPGIMPNEEHIQNGADYNPDGHGFALITRRNRLIIYRSMIADEAIERFMDLRTKHPEGPALFHSRIATSGRVDVSGVHPFRVGSDNRTVVAHNGILFSPPAESPMSDTRIFAETMLPRFGSLDHNNKMAKLEKFCGYSNKLVILTVNPNRRKQAYLVNPALGHWVDGQWHSNYDYKGRTWKDSYVIVGKSAKDSADVFAGAYDSQYQPVACEVCNSYSVRRYTQVCDACHCCNDCLDHEANCQCWYSSRAMDRQKALTAGPDTAATVATLNTKAAREYAARLNT